MLHAPLLLLLAAATTAIVATSASATSDPPPPFWGPVWTAPFNQTIAIYGFTWSNAVAWYYDSTTTPVGSSLYAHGAGQNDEWCTSITGHEFDNEPCNLLASSDGWRYIIYPKTNTCCRACNITNYCGIVRPDWLQQNATYEGTKEIGGRTCVGYMKVGGEQNFWWAEANTSRPCLFEEGYPVLPDTSNIWDFNNQPFSRNPIPASTFAPTPGCTALCQLSDVPYKERLEERWRRRRGVGGGGLRKTTQEE
jgi:hypothetical protein